MGDGPKVEFALGSEVSPGHFFKSSFARSFVSSNRDTKSLDFGFIDNCAIAEEVESNVSSDSRNNNFFSLMNFDSKDAAANVNSMLWKVNEVPTRAFDTSELDKLRKQCQTLTEENRRLQNALATTQVPRAQVIDNVFLQTQLDTLQWQLKQTESNRQMYRSLMEQVVRFLDRARKSLDILHEKNNPRDKSSRVPRSRSVHAVHAEASPGRATSSSSSSSSSSFTRAKSVTQISPNSSVNSSGTVRDFPWSVLRRNETVQCTTPPRSKPPPQDANKTHEGIVYRRPKQLEMDPDDVPPQKLSQEAFRLMRTVQSLLSMREPDLARVSVSEDNVSPSPVEHDLSLPSNFVNSTMFQEPSSHGCASSERGSSGAESDRSCFRKINAELNNGLLPGARRSLDATSLNSGSSKATETTTEEEDATMPTVTSRNADREFVGGSNASTPNRRKKSEKEARSRSKPTNSGSSAEEESGFSSMNSSQEVGLPTVAPFLAKGCHTEVGLPEVPLDKIRHRRWTSTPAEMQALFKRRNASFAGAQTSSPKSLKVLWV